MISPRQSTMLSLSKINNRKIKHGREEMA